MGEEATYEVYSNHMLTYLRRHGPYHSRISSEAKQHSAKIASATVGAYITACSTCCMACRKAYCAVSMLLPLVKRQISTGTRMAGWIKNMLQTCKDATMLHGDHSRTDQHLQGDSSIFLTTSAQHVMSYKLCMPCSIQCVHAHLLCTRALGTSGPSTSKPFSS